MKNKQLFLSVPIDFKEEQYEMEVIKSLADQFDFEFQYDEETKTIILSPAKEGDLPVDNVEEEPPVERIYDTAIIYGVNFRTAPDVEQSEVIRMLRKGEKVHVFELEDSLQPGEDEPRWMRVETEAGESGYISSSTKYTKYLLRSEQETLADKMITFGEKYLGVPYSFGAKLGDTTKFDCSSFVHHVVKNVLDVSLPRTSYNQATKGEEVDKDQIRKGDLLFFTSRDLPIGHVGIYAGNDRILHTYGSGGVRYTGFKGTQWERRFTKATRLI